MPTSTHWTESRRLSDMCAADLQSEGIVFRHGRHLYRTSGEHLSAGGMGSVYVMERFAEDSGAIEPLVGKVFHSQYLYQLRTDEITRRDHESNLQAVDIIGRMNHPHLLPVYISVPLLDNHLFVSPRMGETLHEVVMRGQLSPRRRVALLVQALHGLCALHEARLIHRDVTLRNIILDPSHDHAYLFDFDLTMSLDEVVGVSYNKRYQGRIFGSPGFSVPPEVVDPTLMESAITPRLDIYAIGGALYALFSEQSPHGPTEDMWGLLMRIAEGVVFQGVSKVEYPDEVPRQLRPIIDNCLERDPGHRFGSVRLVLAKLEKSLGELDDHSPRSPFPMVQTVIKEHSMPRRERVQQVHAAQGDNSVTQAAIEIIDTGLSRYGYQVKRSLGRVKGNAIFIVAPAPELVASGQFPDMNLHPKVVTAINLTNTHDPRKLLDLWFGRYLPVLKTVRRGLFTNLYRVVYDEYTGFLFLFSEFVADPRFGTDLYRHDLSLEEALGLGFLAVRQVAQLHEHGLAHNNVRPESLLLKRIEKSRDLVPSMAGLVEPSIDRAAIEADVRNMASLVMSWIKPSSVVTAEQRVRLQMDELRAQLASISFDERGRLTGIDELLSLIAGALSAVDFNFGVLRENGGDIQDYVLLQVSHRLYHRLWTD